MTAGTPPPDSASEKAAEAKPTDTAAALAPAPQRAGGNGLPLGTAAILAVLLVIAAVGGGLAIGTIARPQPTPRPTPTPSASPTPTPLPTTDPAVFRQSLSSGCATEQGIWVVTDGGGLVRYGGKDWTQVDGTLRTLTNASCDAGTLYAVGPVGAVLIIDDRLRQIVGFDVSLEDLRGIAAMPQGAMAVGTHGTVLLLSGGAWTPYASGLQEDLNALVVFDALSAWVVGGQGISYRLETAGWRSIPTGVTVALRGVSSTGPQNAVAVGDAGTVLVFDGTWKPVETGVTANLSGIARLGSAVWIVGDAGTVLIMDATGRGPTVPDSTPAAKLDLGTTCDLRSVFVNGQDVWIIGGRGGVSGVWRVRDGKVAERWGEC